MEKAMLKIQSGNKHELLKQNGKSLLFLVSLSEARPAWFLKGSCPRKAICNIVIKTAEPLKTIKSLQAERPPTAPLTAAYPHSRPARGWNLRTSRPSRGASAVKENNCPHGGQGTGSSLTAKNDPPVQHRAKPIALPRTRLF